MALKPVNEAHGFQIEAGTVGHRKGHALEKELAARINTLDISRLPAKPLPHLVIGNPAALLLGYIQQKTGLDISRAKAW